MPWPTPEDYNDAVQEPLSSFNDSVLRDGTPELTPLGLPRPFTGGSANVYRITSSASQWAVRCFLRDFADLNERYTAIGAQLAGAKLPYTAGFEFLENGIRVRGRWYPILKMEWIEGSSFREYIEENIGNPVALATLAERWITMLRKLKKHNIAHGDLQHGNILISGGNLRLIDYDGMFVPALAGRISPELGHCNYQHPSRTESDFGGHLDNFSGWLIYLTVVALSIEPDLWSRFGKGEEQLLFRKDDFDQPRLSRVFRSMEQLKDVRIQKYLPLFRSFLGMRLSAIASPADVIGIKPKKRETHRAKKAAWIPEVQLDLFALKAPPEVPAAPEEMVTVKPAGVDPELMSPGEVWGKLQVWCRLERRKAQGKLVRRILLRLQTFKAWVEAIESADIQRLMGRVRNCNLKEKTRIADVKSALSWCLEELKTQRDEFDRAELEESLTVLAALQSRHDLLLQEGAFLVNIPVEQLQRTRLRGLLTWRADIEELRRIGPPIILPEREQAQIHGKFEIERQAVCLSESLAQEAAHKKIERIQAGTKRYRERVDARRDQRCVWLERLNQVLRRQIDRGNAWFDANQIELNASAAEMNRYPEIRLSRYLPGLFGFLR